MQPAKKAFTFIEVIVALAIVAIALTALLRLHLISINMTDRTNVRTQAVLLAQSKMDEVTADVSPYVGVTNGTIRRNQLDFNWQRRITELNIPQLDKNDFDTLRRVDVDVSWKHGNNNKHINLTTYVTNVK